MGLHPASPTFVFPSLLPYIHLAMKTLPHISKAQLKYYHSLALKKGRQEEGKFIIEGARLVEEALAAKHPLEAILATPAFLEKKEHAPMLQALRASKDALLEISESELAKLSDTITSQGVIAIAHRQESSQDQFWKNLPERCVLVGLDGISDPGNLGSILRTCDWFGVDGVFLSWDTVELYNPKVVRSTMGAIFHLPIFSEVDLRSVIEQAKASEISVVATTLDSGSNAFDASFPSRSLILLGSEAHGIQNGLVQRADKTVTLPKFGAAESLNVAAACASLLTLLKSKQ